MPETQARLTLLEKTFAAEKAKFDQWKIEHIKGVGTDGYNEYVSNFQRWEQDMIAKRGELINHIRTSSTTGDVDHQLEQILSNVSPTDFVIAMFTAANKDPKFAEAVFNAPQGSSACHPYGSSAAPGYTQVSHYQLPYGAPVTSYATPLVSYHPTSAPNVYTSPYLAAATPPVTVSTPSIAQEAWASATLKSYRPPSPTRDYRKIPQLPFSDFSQT